MGEIGDDEEDATGIKLFLLARIVDMVKGLTVSDAGQFEIGATGERNGYEIISVTEDVASKSGCRSKKEQKIIKEVWCCKGVVAPFVIKNFLHRSGSVLKKVCNFIYNYNIGGKYMLQPNIQLELNDVHHTTKGTIRKIMKQI